MTLERDPGRSFYWGIDIPGLTEAQAARLAAWATDQGIAPWGVITSDPATALTLGIPAPGVRTLAAGLRSLLEKGSDDTAGSLLEILEEWLETFAEADGDAAEMRPQPG